MENKTIYIATNYLSRGYRFLIEKFGPRIKEKAFYSGGLILNAILDDGTYVAVVYPYQLASVNDAVHVYVEEETWRKYKNYLIDRFDSNNITTFRDTSSDFTRYAENA